MFELDDLSSDEQKTDSIRSFSSIETYLQTNKSSQYVQQYFQPKIFLVIELNLYTRVLVLVRVNNDHDDQDCILNVTIN